MTRKKGIYDIVFYATKSTPETKMKGINWKQVQDKLNEDYKGYITVKDVSHATEPYFTVITSETASSSKEKEEYVYTKRK